MGNAPQWGRENRRNRREQARELAKLIMHNAASPTKNNVDVGLALLGCGVSTILVLVPPKSPIAVVILLLFLLAFWVHPLTSLVPWLHDAPQEKKKARNAGAVFALALAICGFGFYVWPHPNQRHLTKHQKEGLGKLAEAVPPNIGVLVRFPPNSKESRAYAMEFWQILHDHHVKAGLPIIAGVEEPPAGLHVYVTSVFDPAGQAGEMFMGGMEDLDLHPLFGERYPWADPKVFVIYVGPKESYD